MPKFSTYGKPVQTLEPGDVYLWGETGGRKATREVLGVISFRPMGGILVEVRKADGNVTRSSLDGYVQVIPREELDVTRDYADGARFARQWMATQESAGNTRESYARMARAYTSPTRRIRAFRLGLARALRSA